MLENFSCPLVGSFQLVLTLKILLTSILNKITHRSLGLELVHHRWERILTFPKGNLKNRMLFSMHFVSQTAYLLNLSWTIIYCPLPIIFPKYTLKSLLYFIRALVSWHSKCLVRNKTIKTLVLTNIGELFPDRLHLLVYIYIFIYIYCIYIYLRNHTVCTHSKEEIY